MRILKAILIVPDAPDNVDPVTVGEVISGIEESLTRQRGGFTLLYGDGSWLSRDNAIELESVSIYMVAGPYADADRTVFRNDMLGLAVEVKRRLKQEKVYLEFQDVEVEFV